MDTIFSHTYRCMQLTELPFSASRHYYFPGASTQAGRDGVLVEVHSEHGQPWLGTFAFGQAGQGGVSGIFTTPNSERFCIVSKGNGYLVNATKPTEWESIQAIPIIDVRQITAHKIIVFADYTALVAYGQAGIKWKTKRLTWDNLKIVEVTDDFIKGEFWDIRSETTANFVVDLATGTHEGGIREV